MCPNSKVAVNESATSRRVGIELLDEAKGEDTKNTAHMTINQITGPDKKIPVLNMTHGYFSIRRHDSWILSRHQPACKVHDCVQKRDLLILASTHFLRDVITFYTAAHVCCRHTCVFGSVRSTQWEAKRKSSQQSRGESFFLRKVPQTWFVGD